MAKTFTTRGRMQFWSGVRALFSVDFGFAPFNNLHAHLLGFGFGIIYIRGLQFSVSGRVPFYQAARYRMTMRLKDDALAGKSEPFAGMDTWAEAIAKSVIGVTETDDEYRSRIARYRGLTYPTPNIQRILAGVDRLIELDPSSTEARILSSTEGDQTDG